MDDIILLDKELQVTLLDEDIIEQVNDCVARFVQECLRRQADIAPTIFS